jgi:putative transposase
MLWIVRYINVEYNIMDMDSIRAYKFRIYPDVKREAEINERLLLAKEFYNLLLENSIKSYKNGNNKISMAILNRFAREIVAKDKKYLKLYSQTRCEIGYRILKAYQNFFRRIKEKKDGKMQKVGFPRFKSKDRYKSISYPQYNGSFSIEKNRLRVSRIGTMKVEMHRKVDGKIKTLAIKKEAGKYYAIFTAVRESKPHRVPNARPVGIDLGLSSFIAMSDGTKMQKPKFMNEGKKRLARWQRIVAKRHKGSKRRERAKMKLQKEWEYITNLSNDYLHKLSAKLVGSGYTSFVIEKLNIRNMVKNHRLAGSIYNASWNKFVQLLSYKAESAGLEVIRVAARNTSRTCSNCGNIQEMLLSERMYSCSRCGLRIDRDINASINILNRATAGHTESHARGDSVRPQNGAGVAEPRTYSATCRGSLGL